jgi:hypothetical protein
MMVLRSTGLGKSISNQLINTTDAKRQQSVNAGSAGSALVDYVIERT